MKIILETGDLCLIDTKGEENITNDEKYFDGNVVELLEELDNSWRVFEPWSSTCLEIRTKYLESCH